MITKEDAYKKIQELVTRFGEQIDSYKQADYNETLTRRDFIDPFFKALGWDVDNSQGYAEAYREVIHEDRVKVGKATKAPDYSFRLPGGKRLFFVEAKKPSVTIKDDISVAYQIRRYGWSAKLPISIITDFEEFAVYDCTKKPNPTDKTGVARIKYINFKDYLTEFEYLWDTFSKERVLKGSFDKYIQSDTVKKGTATVDKEFLSSLDNWRTYLATTISLRNKELDEDEINYAVQLTIDRLIFLRIAEDRGVEQYGQLKNSVNQKGDSYQNLFFNFKKADEKYNSGLFDFSKDVISEKLQIDNKVIKTIVNEMYYPESPYEFSVISVEILGSAYEQFLGKVIRITPAHHAKIEEKPEVRKAGGVYYTPQYVVDYIVKNTVGKLIDGKTPKQIEKIKIADPACGSGSFLIGAYQYLLDYHKNYYTENGTKTGKKDNPTTPEGNLTSAEKKKILLNNIYGVDIDVNAVEVTKLSLLLKCMEGETETTIAQQQKLWHERILPTLDDNIKSGNSLVENAYLLNEIDFGVDFRKVKPFDWEAKFPDIFQNGGFDIIIGNPPYSAKQSTDNKYLTPFYKTVEYKCDLYAFFVERAYQLIKKNGTLGFIIPVSWMTNIYFRKLREFLINTKSLKRINLIDGLVFESANIDTGILLLNKEGVKEKQLEWVHSKAGDLEAEIILRDYSQFKIDDGYSISSVADDRWYKIKEKIDNQSIELGKISKISLGMKLRSNDEFIVSEKDKNNPDCIVFGKDVSKYSAITPIRFFNFSKAVIVGGTKNPKIQQAKTKIFIQAIRNLSLNERIVATLDNNGYYFIGTVNSVILNTDDYDYRFILGLLNSELHNLYFKKRFTTISLTASFLGVLPICLLKTEKQKKLENEIIKLVDMQFELNAELEKCKLPDKIENLKFRIKHNDNMINIRVYEIFGLSKDEIEIMREL
jgi:type I restriction-modification system DNA methylase subunit